MYSESQRFFKLDYEQIKVFGKYCMKPYKQQGPVSQTNIWEIRLRYVVRLFVKRDQGVQFLGLENDP